MFVGKLYQSSRKTAQGDDLLSRSATDSTPFEPKIPNLREAKDMKTWRVSMSNPPTLGTFGKVSFPLWHSSFVILLVGPTLLWKGREICLNLCSNKFCRLEFGGDMGTHSCFI